MANSPPAIVGDLQKHDWSQISVYHSGLVCTTMCTTKQMCGQTELHLFHMTSFDLKTYARQI